MVSGRCDCVACCGGTLSIVQILMFQGKYKNGRFAAYKLNLSYLHSQEVVFCLHSVGGVL